MSTSADKSGHSSNEMDLSGRELAGFQVLRRLGRGAMADVYLAEQTALKRRVALKVLKPELASDTTYLKRFEREAQAAAALVHANIVQIYEVGNVGRWHYIAQEYVEGQNLREWLARRGPPDLPHALSIMRQVAAALAKAGEAGIVHRDIKPENIMLTRNGEVKVADFGLARLAREGEGVELTRVGITLGTPLYMSPEQVEGKPLDPRSDIYSLGVTCYQMLAGQPPFSGETALGVAVQHLKKQPEPLEGLRPDLPPALCRVVHKMLAKSPEQRYQSAKELLRELRRLQLEYCGENWPEELPGWDTSGVELSDDPRVQATQRLSTLMKSISLERPRRWHVWAAAAAVVLACVAGGLLAWALAEPPLLRELPDQPARFPRQPTAWRQWYYAAQSDTEEAWRSVIEYFGDNPYIVRRAEEQLAQLYLRQGDYARARALFDKFVDEGSENEESLAFGLAGRCGVLALEGHYREAVQMLSQLMPIRDKLRSAQMRRLLDFVVSKTRMELGAQTAEQWEKWLQQQARQQP
jgi:serine/threonine protein kinase